MRLGQFLDPKFVFDSERKPPQARLHDGFFGSQSCIAEDEGPVGVHGCDDTLCRINCFEGLATARVLHCEPPFDACVRDQLKARELSISGQNGSDSEPRKVVGVQKSRRCFLDSGD